MFVFIGVQPLLPLFRADGDRLVARSGVMMVVVTSSFSLSFCKENHESITSSSDTV